MTWSVRVDFRWQAQSKVKCLFTVNTDSGWTGLTTWQTYLLAYDYSSWDTAVNATWVKIEHIILSAGSDTFDYQFTNPFSTEKKAVWNKSCKFGVAFLHQTSEKSCHIRVRRVSVVWLVVSREHTFISVKSLWSSQCLISRNLRNVVSKLKYNLKIVAVRTPRIDHLV